MEIMRGNKILYIKKEGEHLYSRVVVLSGRGRISLKREKMIAGEKGDRVSTLSLIQGSSPNWEPMWRRRR
jgi:hypothetical protein